jgi:hypothetical protein
MTGLERHPNLYEVVKLESSQSPDEWREMAKVINARNKAKYQEMVEQYKAWCKLAALWIPEQESQYVRGKMKFGTSKKWMSLRDTAPPTPFDWAHHVEYTLNNLARKKEEAKAKTNKEVKRKSDEISKHIRAMAFLVERGWRLLPNGNLARSDGAIFESDSFVSCATDVRVEELKDQRIDEESGYVRFSGDDECRSCLGWDGDSSRCQCGNRRVSWEYDGDFEDTNLYASAY